MYKKMRSQTLLRRSAVDFKTQPKTSSFDWIKINEICHSC